MKYSYIFFIIVTTLFFEAAYANPCPSDNVYAQKIDGCSSWSSNPKQVRDTYGSVNFNPACNQHDICYYTLGTSEASCNNAFYKRLLKACKDGLTKCKTVLGEKICITEPASYTACSTLATTMYAAVRGASRSVYRKAQDKQRKHEQECRVSSSIDASCGNIEIRPSNNNLNYSRGHSWQTCSGFKFIFQNDGNLVLYRPDGTPVWATGTNGSGTDNFAVQADGNLVLYDHGQAVWASDTSGRGRFFAIQSDGNLVVYSSNGKPLWSSNTHSGKMGSRSASAEWR